MQNVPCSMKLSWNLTMAGWFSVDRSWASILACTLSFGFNSPIEISFSTFLWQKRKKCKERKEKERKMSRVEKPVSRMWVSGTETPHHARVISLVPPAVAVRLGPSCPPSTMGAQPLNATVCPLWVLRADLEPGALLWGAPLHPIGHWGFCTVSVSTSVWVILPAPAHPHSPRLPYFCPSWTSSSFLHSLSTSHSAVCSISLPLCLCLCMCLPVSLCVSVCVYVSVSLCVSPSLSLSPLRSLALTPSALQCSQTFQFNVSPCEQYLFLLS